MVDLLSTCQHVLGVPSQINVFTCLGTCMVRSWSSLVALSRDGGERPTTTETKMHTLSILCAMSCFS